MHPAHFVNHLALILNNCGCEVRRLSSEPSAVLSVDKSRMRWYCGHFRSTRLDVLYVLRRIFSRLVKGMGWFEIHRTHFLPWIPAAGVSFLPYLSNGWIGRQTMRTELLRCRFNTQLCVFSTCIHVFGFLPCNNLRKSARLLALGLKTPLNFLVFRQMYTRCASNCYTYHFVSINYKMYGFLHYVRILLVCMDFCIFRFMKWMFLGVFFF